MTFCPLPCTDGSVLIFCDPIGVTGVLVVVVIDVILVGFAGVVGACATSLHAGFLSFICFTPLPSTLLFNFSSSVFV